MKKRIILKVFGLAFVSSAQLLYSQANADTEKTLQNKEQVTWQAWKDHDGKAVESMTPENAVNISGGIIMEGKQRVLKGFTDPDCKVNSFSLSDFSYMWLDKDTVIVRYTANQDVACKGQKPLVGNVIASSVWHKQNGTWTVPYHQETEPAK
jgi:hypothetical protein